MKCSLLTLSTFVDGELAPQRRAEVDAHLVGCTRCSAGAATLKEERTRIGQLARVTVDPASAQLMLEQVGIAIDPTAEHIPVPPTPPAPVDERRPWQAGTSSPALPWTPRRPVADAGVRVSGDVVAPTAAIDVQPDLPLDGVRSVPLSWNRSAPASDPPRPTAVADVGTSQESPAPPEVGPTELDEEWLNGIDASENSWDGELLPPPADISPPPDIAPLPPDVSPPRAGASPPPEQSWTAPAQIPSVEPLTPAPAAPAPEVPVHASPPTRLAAASGPGAVWTRIHDAITVRLALARGGQALEDSVQIVSGAPARRGAPLPAPEPELPSSSGIVAAPPTSQAPAQPQPASDVELSRAEGAPLHAELIADVSPELLPADQPVDRRYHGAEVGDQRDRSEPADTAGWNAFAASSYPDVEIPAEQPVGPRPPRQLGRHGRAVAREQVPLSTRVGRVTSTATAGIRAGTGRAAGRVRQGVARLGATGPDNRLLAGIAAVGLIFVVALIIGRGSSHPTATTPPRPVSTSAQPPARQSAPAQSSPPAATSAPAAPAPVQTYGAGDTGFQVIRLRYGLQAAFSRVVFDLGAASAGATGTPRVSVSFSSPTSLLVTFSGTLPAGSTGTPTPGRVISSVSLVSSTGNKTVYRFGLTRAATTTAFYLASPTRFVLDIH